MAEVLKPQEPVIPFSKDALAVEARMVMFARNARNKYLDTPHLMAALFIDPSVETVLGSMGVTRENFTAVAWPFGPFSEEPLPPRPLVSHTRSKFLFFRRKTQEEISPEIEEELKLSPALAIVARLTQRNAQRRHTDQIVPLDLLETVISHSPSAAHTLLTENLKIDEKRLLEEIEKRRQLESVLSEVDKILKSD